MYGPAVFEWPKFAAHLDAGRTAADRVRGLLDALAVARPAAGADEVLVELFGKGALADEIERLAPRLHHAGLIAPPGIDIAEVAELLGDSPFRGQVRRFKSAVLAKDLSARLGRNVNVMVVQGNAAAPASGCPSVEVFVADLPASEIDRLVAGETGCHVALALAPDASLARVLEVLHAHGRWEIPLMRNGPLANYEIHSSLLYVDIPGLERMRRLEIIASDATQP